MRLRPRAKTERMLRQKISCSVSVTGADSYLLKQAAIQSVFIFQMKRDSCRLSGLDNFSLEFDRFSWLHIRDARASDGRPVFIIEVRDQPSRKKHSKRT